MGDIEQPLSSSAEVPRDGPADEALVRLREELDVASEIQRSMLPQAFPDLRDADVFARMIPAKSVGGDFYDFFFLEENTLGVVIADVAGKGIPGALFMALARTLTKSIALTGVAADECLRRVNRALCEERRSYLFVTLFYAIVDVQTGHVEYCNGGHNPPYHVPQRGRPRELAAPGGMVLGVKPDGDYEAGHVRLQPGDSLFLFTDGVSEAMTPERELYGDERLCDALERGPRPSEALIEAVLEDVRKHTGGADPRDDVTMLAVHLRGK